MRPLSLFPVLSLLACATAGPDTSRVARLEPAPIPDRVADHQHAGFMPNKDGGILGGMMFIAASFLGNTSGSH